MKKISVSILVAVLFTVILVTGCERRREKTIDSLEEFNDSELDADISTAEKETPINDKLKETDKDAFSYAIKEDNTVVILGLLDDSLQDINIPESIDGLNVSAIGNEAFKNNNIISIYIPDTVTSIGKSAFEDCSFLKTVKMSFGLEMIEAYAFSGCSSLENIVIPNNVTKIDDYAFAGCRDLEQISIPDSVIYIGIGAFRGCSRIIDITIPQSVAYIGETVLSNCSALKEIRVDVNNIYYTSRDIEGNECNVIVRYENENLIAGCANSIIPENVILIADEAFFNCINLECIDVPDGVTSIGWGAFYGCKNLHTANLSDSILSIGEYAFYDCSKLTDIHIPEYLEEIYLYTFYNCQSLMNLYIPENVKYIGDNAFEGCDTLKLIQVEAGSYVEEWANENEYKIETYLPRDTFGFDDLAGKSYWFWTGHGGWYEKFCIEKDGSFFGIFLDTNMGENAPEYEYGTQYNSIYFGQLDNITKIDDYTYAVELKHINYDYEIDSQMIVDKVLNIYTESYFWSDAKILMIYLPGTPINELPDWAYGWIEKDVMGNTELTDICIANAADINAALDYGRYSPEVEAVDIFCMYETLYSYYNELMHNALSTYEMRDYAIEMQNISDKCMEAILRLFKYNLSKKDYGEFLKEQEKWADERNAEVENYCEMYEGGSYASVAYSEKYANITMARCEELKNYFR